VSRALLARTRQPKERPLSGLTDYQKFVADISAASYFGNWKRNNPGEYARWVAFDKAVQAGPAEPIVLRTKFGQALVDAAVIYLNAYESGEPAAPPVAPPVSPPVSPPASTTGPFQSLWDQTRLPAQTWSNPVTVSSQAALDSFLANRSDGAHAIVRGFNYKGRLEIRGGGRFWLECDPSFSVTNRGTGSGFIGLWLVSTNGAVITGFPVLSGSGNQGLRAQAARDCWLELETRGNGGNGLLLDQIAGAGTKTGGVFKIRGGGNGLGAMPPGSPGYDPAFYSPEIDPHAQKGTGAHHANIWMLEAGTTLLLDVNLEQRYGAGCQTTGLQGTSSRPITLAVRAPDLSCDVNAIPPSPSGGRQEAGNAWQPWGDAHSYVKVAAIECGRATRGVYSITQASSCSVAYGRVANPRQSPCWSGSGISWGDVQPTP
jgi:hypothetical protein